MTVGCTAGSDSENVNRLIKGNLHLSSDLKRLMFVKAFVWLTRPSRFINNDELLFRYKQTVLKYKNSCEWKIEPQTGRTVSGQGIGKKEVASSEDKIALNHLVLAQELGFLKREVNTWSNFGFVLASLYCDLNGVLLFTTASGLERYLATKGLLAKIEVQEQLLFASSLFETDFDGTFPLLLMIDDKIDKQLLKNSYFSKVADWYAIKRHMGDDYQTRRDCLLNEARFRRKSHAQGSAAETHREEQILPRLEFLLDLGLIYRVGTEAGSRYSLSTQGKDVMGFLTHERALVQCLSDPFEMRSRLVQIFAKGFNDISFSEFKRSFVKVARFYRRCGTVLLSYPDVFLALACDGLRNRMVLSHESYETNLSDLERRGLIAVSRAIPLRSYIRVKE